MLFNDAINNIVGTSGLSKIIIVFCTIGIVFSVLVFYPFSYTAFYVCTLTAFSANLLLSYGGGKTWFINLQDPDYIPAFVGNETGTKIKIEFDYETSDGQSDTQIFEIKSNGNPNHFDSPEAAAMDSVSNNIIDYLENCVHITSIVKSYNTLSEAKMFAALGSFKIKKVNTL